ncbi:MAG: hypothetical protein A2284_16605 [Deltaproteobacteria bacterium RIFOXYA12_FULL_61_11]|nr:MAG: hypothetical protein A2284_16605 [Deltaproteobacteria bacterium RIFOXYA12_FULL_61_11]
MPRIFLPAAGFAFVLLGFLIRAQGEGQLGTPLVREPAPILEEGFSYPALSGEAQAMKYFERPYPNGEYVVTTFGGGSDAQGTACGVYVDGSTYYSTGVYGWGCHAKVRVTANGKCVIVHVLDNGPAAWVEEKAAGACGQGRILDVSPLVTKHLFGINGSGWSDCNTVNVAVVDKSAPEGPCTLGADPGDDAPEVEEPAENPTPPAGTGTQVYVPPYSDDDLPKPRVQPREQPASTPAQPTPTVQPQLPAPVPEREAFSDEPPSVGGCGLVRRN